MKRVSLTLSVFLLLPFALAAEAAAQARDFNPRIVVRRKFPAITKPPVVSAQQADKVLHEAELVLGVTVGGRSRAYPINMLTGPRREIINDTLGESAIAATW